MLKAADFRPVTLADRDFFVKHYQRFPQSHSDNTFTNMVCWNDYAHYRYAYVDDCVMLCSTIAGMTRFRPPIGPGIPDRLKEGMALAIASEGEYRFVILVPETKAWRAELFPQLEFHPER